MFPDDADVAGLGSTLGKALVKTPGGSGPSQLGPRVLTLLILLSAGRLFKIQVPRPHPRLIKLHIAREFCKFPS